jgi:hypothetical protein
MLMSNRLHAPSLNRKLRGVVTNDRDDLEQLGVPRPSDVEASVVVLVVDRHRILGRMLDVLVGDSVLARRHSAGPCLGLTGEDLVGGSRGPQRFGGEP